MGATVRRAELGDAEGIAAAQVASWQAAYVGLIPQEVLDGMSVSRRVAGWRESIAVGGDDTFVAVDTATADIVGFVNVGPSRDADAGQEVGELRAIYLRPERWRTGVGQQLHDTALEPLCRRFTSATLWVLDGNERARSFYERNGWQLDGAQRQDDRGDVTLSEVRYRRPLMGQPGRA